MRFVRGWAVVGLALVQGLSAPALADAGWLYRRPGPLPEYSAGVRNYVVVGPAESGVPQGWHTAHQNGSPYSRHWRQQASSNAAYPWGWFGAAPRQQNTSHTRYYGESQDWTVRRGN